MTGDRLAHCAACPVPEIANVFSRAKIDFHQVTGMLHDDPAYFAALPSRESYGLRQMRVQDRGQMERFSFYAWR
jgi:hypothetical protein